MAELSAGAGMREAYLAAIENDREEPSVRALGRLVRMLEPTYTSYERLARLLTSPEFDPSGEYPRGQLPPLPAPAAPVVANAKAGGDRLQAAPAAPEPSALQFDHAVTDGLPTTSAYGVAVICSACQRAIDTEYFDVNGQVLCDRCRATAESALATPTGVEPFIVASVFGLGAAIAGAIVYYAVIAIANLQIGYVAILIGYMVGYAVRKGARGLGGRRFQMLAVVLTYFAVGLAYTPVVFKQMETSRAASTAKAPAKVVAQPQPNARVTTPSMLWAPLVLLVFVFALQVLVVVGSLPFGFISGFIIFIGLRQSWRMTAAPQVQVFGPYRVGKSATAGVA